MAALLAPTAESFNQDLRPYTLPPWNESYRVEQTHAPGSLCDLVIELAVGARAFSLKELIQLENSLSKIDEYEVENPREFLGGDQLAAVELVGAMHEEDARVARGEGCLSLAQRQERADRLRQLLGERLTQDTDLERWELLSACEEIGREKEGLLPRRLRRFVVRNAADVLHFENLLRLNQQRVELQKGWFPEQGQPAAELYLAAAAGVAAVEAGKPPSFAARLIAFERSALQNNILHSINELAIGLQRRNPDAAWHQVREEMQEALVSSPQGAAFIADLKELVRCGVEGCERTLSNYAAVIREGGAREEMLYKLDGYAAEARVALALIGHGFRVVSMSVRRLEGEASRGMKRRDGKCSEREIDIVAEKDGERYFIEVKRSPRALVSERTGEQIRDLDYLAQKHGARFQIMLDSASGIAAFRDRITRLLQAAPRTLPDLYECNGRRLVLCVRNSTV